MRFDELLDWQWRDYPEKHRNYNNLLIHIFAVPLFWIGALHFVGALLFRGALFGIGGLALMAIAIFLQGKGHEMEKAEAAPFKSPVDFTLRILAEQFVTFPRFVLTGGWWANFKAAG
jgi:hypothetical protein